MTSYALGRESAQQVARFLSTRCASDEASSDVAAALYALLNGDDEEIMLSDHEDAPA